MKRIYNMFGLLLLILLCGCNKHNNKMGNVIYKSEVVNLEQFQEGVSDYCVERGKIFFWIDNDADTDNIYTRLYKSDLNGENIQEIILSESDRNKFIIDLSIDSKENMALLLGEEVDNTIDVSVLMLGADGKILYEKNAMTDSIPNKLVLCEKNRVALMSKNSLMIFDQNGCMVDEKDFDYSLVDIMQFSEESVLCAGYKKNQLVIEECDTENFRVISKIELDNMNFTQSDMLMTGFGYDFAVRTDKEIYGCKMDGECELLDELSKMNADIDEKLVRVDENTILGLIPRTNGLIRRYRRENGVQQKSVVKVAILSDDSNDLRQNIMRFNRNNAKFEIELIDYSQSENPIVDMNCDISAGKSPDIIELSGISINRMAKKGILADLTPYFNEDERINENDLLNTVKEAMKIEQKYYYVAPEFSIYTIIGKTSEVGNEEGWIFDDFYSYAKGGKDDGIFLDDSADDLLSMFSETIISDHVDWKEQSCDFDTEEFKKILEFCKLYKNENSKDLTANSFEQGEVSLINAKVSPLDIQFYEHLFGEDITFIGFPNESKRGSFFKFSNCLGILESSKNKDEAWEFISLFMTKEYQGDSDNIVGLPTRKDAYKLAIKELAATTSYTDELGKEIQPFEQEMFYYDYSVKLEPLNEMDSKKYEALIQNTNRAFDYDSTILDIIKDESQLYFDGKKNVDEVIDVINNRVSLYISE